MGIDGAKDDSSEELQQNGKSWKFSVLRENSDNSTKNEEVI